MLSTVERVLFLMRTPLFSRATTDALARLASIARERELAPGERLFAREERADGLYVVVRGSLRVEAEDGSFSEAQPGDALGAAALFADEPYGATAIVREPTLLFTFDRGELEDLLDEDGELGRALLQGVTRGHSRLQIL